jgi:hypothetical protein
MCTISLWALEAQHQATASEELLSGKPTAAGVVDLQVKVRLCEWVSLAGSGQRRNGEDKTPPRETGCRGGP